MLVFLANLYFIAPYVIAGIALIISIYIIVVVQNLVDATERARDNAEKSVERLVEKVDRIKNKLKELEEKEKQELKGLKGQDRYFVKQLYDTKINLLNELLE